MELKLTVITKGTLTEVEEALVANNIWALLNEVRPDLVQEEITTVIEEVEVSTMSFQDK